MNEDGGWGTVWNLDGTVMRQTRTSIVGPIEQLVIDHTKAPPWLWGVTDQAEPSMPAWMKDDEKWAKALEEAR